jgi:hypothetical protein
MPVSKLTIRKQPNKPLYKVYDEGRPLSLKGISKTMAERQKTAVILSELRKMGRVPPLKTKAKPKSKSK